jgi:hypothetical protein
LGSETVRNVGLALIALGVSLVGLVIWRGLTSSFVVGYVTNPGGSLPPNCIGSNGNLNPNCAISDYSPLYISLFVGLGLVSIGILMVALTGIRTGSNLQGKRGEFSVDKLVVLLLSYSMVPVVTVLLLLTLANSHVWSGSPATYVGPCGILLLRPGIQGGWCYTLIWDGFWIDMLLYTAIGYGIIIFLSLIPKNTTTTPSQNWKTNVASRRDGGEW